MDAALFDKDLSDESKRDIDLLLSAVDTFATVYVNDVEVGRTDNMFREYRFPVRHALREGKNRLRIAIASPVASAKAEAAKLPFVLPKNGNNAVPYMNAIRKVQCHAGWDWGICLPVSGIYAAPVLEAHPGVYLQSLNATQIHEDGKVKLTVTAEIFSKRQQSVGGWTFALRDGKRVRLSNVICCPSLKPGNNVESATFEIENPKLWFPNGYGEQPLYQVSFKNRTLGKFTRRVGLRTVEVVSEPDAVGRGLHFRVNGVDVFAKGANWIPVDALPQRQTPDAYARLLTAARDCHMNMIRVWGGGQYEKDCFYDLCDELGLLVWQDCMFACAVYPGTPEFIANVEKELDYQIRRLRTHPCLALWCGDNECLKGLTWNKEANEKKRFYMVNYDRLNRALANKVAELDPGRVFRQSSPSAGSDDLYDKDPGDRSGDIHYWDVWHGGKKFEAYRKVQPRFCSEFGYQAFPSEAQVFGFTAPEDRNVFSPVMDAHQKCRSGNAPIIAMFGNYFRMPRDFGGFLYLSQVQQAVAMKTGIEYWRTLRPLCMGTLYWQLNDVWPAASWSSIEYGGRWKQMQYHARSFYAPVMTTALAPLADGAAADAAPAAVEIWSVNDRPRPCAVTVSAEIYDFSGNRLRRQEFPATLPAGSALPVGVLALDGAAPESCFVMLRTRPQGSKEILHENTFFPAPWKRCPLRPAKVKAVVDERLGLAVRVKAEAPAFFVHLTAGDLPGNFSDSSFTLLPGEEKTVLFQPFPGQAVSFADFARAVKVQDLESATR
ncbi:MAG: glycoside hydrolase family 2 protein [Planctomycetes bacterium]|nr:glycoside hydrolase family 2 protein [Planctomycetota bacterium]